MKYSLEVLNEIFNYHLKEQKSISQIAKERNINRRSLTRALSNNGFKINNYKSNGHFVYEYYFSSIDTNNKAYILGLLYADGCLTKCKHRPTVSLTLHIQDKYLLDKISKCIGKNIPVYIEKNNKATIKIQRPQWEKDLLKWGVFNNKSNNGDLSFPNIDEQYVGAFIRGFLDGDGSVNKLGHFRLCGTSKQLLEDIKNILQSLGCSKKVNLHKAKTKKGVPYYYLHFATKDTTKIIYPFIYKNAELFLERKKKRIENYI